MAYLIDTDWLVDYLVELPEAVALFEPLPGASLAVSIISCVELFEGVERSDDPETAEEVIRNLLGRLEVVPVSLLVARRCAAVRAGLRRLGKRVNSRAMDLLIAATALEHGLTLVTRNRDDYKDIPGLRLYDS